MQMQHALHHFDVLSAAGDPRASETVPGVALCSISLSSARAAVLPSGTTAKLAVATSEHVRRATQRLPGGSAMPANTDGERTGGQRTFVAETELMQRERLLREGVDSLHTAGTNRTAMACRANVAVQRRAGPSVR